MNYQYSIAHDPDERLKLMEFVYKNTDSFIMNTFGYLWESRRWWDKFPIQTVTENDQIIALHAFTVNTKAPNTLKTYYIVTHKDKRGEGLAKKLTIQALKDYQYECDTFFVNSEETSPGIGFYKKIFNNKFKIEINGFNTNDYVFESPIKEILLNNF